MGNDAAADFLAQLDQRNAQRLQNAVASIQDGGADGVHRPGKHGGSATNSLWVNPDMEQMLGKGGVDSAVLKTFGSLPVTDTLPPFLQEGGAQPSLTIAQNEDRSAGIVK